MADGARRHDRLRFFGIAEAEAVGALEFVAQLRGFQVFADVGEALLERKQGFCDGLGVGVGDVAPHGEGAGAEPRHLAQSAAADGQQVGVGGEFVFEQGAHGGGDELRQMADPGAEDVMAGWIEVDDATAEARDPGAPFLRRPARPDLSRWTAWSEEPDCAIEERAVGIFSAADFFACHGVAGEKSGLAGRVVFGMGAGTDCAFDAADIGDELVFTEDGSEPVEPLEDGEDGPPSRMRLASQRR